MTLAIKPLKTLLEFYSHNPTIPLAFLQHSVYATGQKFLDLGQRPPTSLVTGANPCVPPNAHVLEA